MFQHRKGDQWGDRERVTRWANGRKLTAAFVRSVHEPGLYWDEHGLVLRVKPSGYKQWIQRLFIHGKRRELGLGPVRLVTLAEARDAALANRKVARAGGDPRATRRRSVPTFERAAAKVFAMHRTSWSAKHAAQWASTLRMYAHPRIGGKRVDRITSADVMGVLMPIWSAKHTTAKRVRERIGTVMKWAIAQATGSTTRRAKRSGRRCLGPAMSRSTSRRCPSVVSRK